MTEHEKKWTEIGIAYHTPLNERTEKQVEMTRYGLCSSADPVHLGSFITDMVQVTVAMTGKNEYWIAPRFKYLRETEVNPQWRPINDIHRGNLAFDIAGMGVRLFKSFRANVVTVEEWKGKK